jgi:hypothetical protein
MSNYNPTRLLQEKREQLWLYQSRAERAAAGRHSSRLDQADDLVKAETYSRAAVEMSKVIAHLNDAPNSAAVMERLRCHAYSLSMRVSQLGIDSLSRPVKPYALASLSHALQIVAAAVAALDDELAESASAPAEAELSRMREAGL